ncbi:MULTISPECIES: threo-3-hydroxy-L-aspartate ammonia-lyase [Aminobacter]|uniref:threo-3-hydroxy-L-aspartate ammonia-lyase n=1 Tax=Aminobacter TaxID=31988 RepID=UPI000D505C7B|nr:MULTISPECIES: threo-3-hydroxy-L-aspartate ammonia-lyase [Aminobacter]AWC23959.1 Phenylserine dehydratase [Aminobacter sp. MSH1]CAI2934646.1 L-threo-3-hydroxyaspartate ammonia-lyase [Aminobacter niigataensis]
MASPSLRIPTFDDVKLAQARLAGAAHKTPILTSRTADAQTGATLYFKAENLQRAGAFKFRGAYNAIAVLDQAMRANGVVAYSSGNHAQALAYAASLLGVSATIIMPKDAPVIKVAATRGYGAEIVFYDRYTEDREKIARGIAAERGAALIPPYDHADVIAGQGTAALELIEDTGDLDLLVVPLGGGGLLAGCALSARALSPACRIVGVEPEAGNDGQQSLRKGEVVHIAPPKSIADGAIVTHVGYHNFPILKDKVDDIVTVTDAQLVDTVRFFAERMKIIVEPTGCLAAAAVLHGALGCAGKRVGIVLSGGNVDLKVLSTLLA